jgi:hypothetical protein
MLLGKYPEIMDTIHNFRMVPPEKTVKFFNILVTKPKNLYPMIKFLYICRKQEIVPINYSSEIFTEMPSIIREGIDRFGSFEEFLTFTVKQLTIT